ncbi:Xaa-Pro peptidase family protein [Parabacteroides sp. Marseille-P3160]|uniref:M24 family metallopeptidase n=1 Tax=Parabacteroides sp. Marseille-P3160 TaxID=1917887 RepID=UPI0009BC09DB|nr:Xaa-Pro peptidase family protein [Parabacteroides sp. Marseille-P3160]
MVTEKRTDELKSRWLRIQDGMRKSNAEACLFSVDVNLYYTTGHIYNGYFYLPVEGSPSFFVKRPEGLCGENVYSIRKPEQIPDLLAAKGEKLPKKIMLEADEIPYGEYIRLQSAFQPEETGNATALIRRIREIKSDWEVGQFRLSARQHEKTYGEIRECFRPGMTDTELQIEIEKRMRLNGSIGIFRTFGGNMDIFMGSILAGDNAGNPSPFDFALGGQGITPTLPIGANGTVLKEGMTILVDMAGNYTAYITDISRVFAIGKLPDEAYRAHQVALDIQRKMEETARPGTPCAELYELAVSMAKKEGLIDKFMGTKQQAKFVGHGIGIQINELPVLMLRSKELLQPGMVFAYEPKFVLPGVGAVGIENSYLVTDSGLEKLTLFEEEIIQLE